jgi:hypothetical protein
MDYFDDSQDEFNFEETGVARWTDPETSHQAAESLNAADLAHLYSVVWETLVKNQNNPKYPHGLITREIAFLAGVHWGSISPRMKTMRLKGWVFNTGERRPWHGAPGNPASSRLSIVWQLSSLRKDEEQSKTE